MFCLSFNKTKIQIEIFFGLTTLCQWPVVVDVVDSSFAAPEQLGPVDSVVVTELDVLTDVHAAIADLAEGAQTQWGQGGDAHHHQRETPSVWGLEEEKKKKKIQTKKDF